MLDPRVMTHCTRLIALLAAVAALAVPGTAGARETTSLAVVASAPCSHARATPTPSNLATVRHATLCLLNAERAKRGLKPLRLNARLSASSAAYARLMVAKHFFSHVSPAGSTLSSRVKKTGYLKDAQLRALAENIAWGGGPAASAAEIARAWMRSADHKANILDGRLKEIGIGIAYGTPMTGQAHGATYTTDFGARA